MSEKNDKERAGAYPGGGGHGGMPPLSPFWSLLYGWGAERRGAPKGEKRKRMKKEGKKKKGGKQKEKRIEKREKKNAQMATHLQRRKNPSFCAPTHKEGGKTYMLRPHLQRRGGD